LRALPALAAAAALLTVLPAAPAGAEPLAPETMLAERTNPAMHLVTVDYSATVSMKTTVWSGDGKDLIKEGFGLLATRRLSTIDQVIDYAFSVAASDPERYFRGVGQPRTATLKDGTSGSGFVVNGDGILVTARHVVTDDGSIRAGFARDGAAAFAAAETKDWRKAYRKWGLSDQTVAAIKKAMAAYATAKVKVTMDPPAVSVILGVADADGSRTGKTQPAEVSLAAHSLPQGAPVYINCFPALPASTEAAELTPTLTDGRVTSLKLNKGGIEEMQTDAQASPGCSGGAGLDQDGNVVGVLVSGAVNGQGASLGQFYLMPIDLVREALQTRNVQVEVSLTTQLYNQALADYSQNYYSRALEAFQHVKSLYPGHPYVSHYISECQSRISRGEDQTPVPPPPGLLDQLPAGVIGLLGGVVVAALAGAVLLVLRRRRRGAGGAATSAEPLVGGDGPGRDDPVSGEARATGPLVGAPERLAEPVLVGAHSVPEATSAGPAEQLPGDPLEEGSEDDEDADAIPEWVPVDYVAAFPAGDEPRPAV
jgi:hypothetical protein